MRIRTIKPEFFHHETLFEAEESSGLPLRLAFIGLWCAADRDGLFKWETRRLGVQIMPYDKIDFSRVLDALTTRGFIRKYEHEGVAFGVIPSFLRHQVINNRERDSELPKPLEYIEFDACLTREPRVNHAGKAEGKGREEEGKGMEEEGNRNGIPPGPQGGETFPGVEKSPTKSKGTAEELRAYAVELGLPESDGDAMHDHWEANGWRNGSSPSRDWQAGIRKWKSQGWLPSQKARHGTVSMPAKPHRSREYPQADLELP